MRAWINVFDSADAKMKNISSYLSLTQNTFYTINDMIKESKYTSRSGPYTT